MGKILTEISEGELLDKITILEIKLEEIKNQSLLKEVEKEYKILSIIKDNNIDKNHIVDNLFNELKLVNKEIWDIENIKRNFEKENIFDDKFIKISSYKITFKKFFL